MQLSVKVILLISCYRLMTWNYCYGYSQGPENLLWWCIHRPLVLECLANKHDTVLVACLNWTRDSNCPLSEEAFVVFEQSFNWFVDHCIGFGKLCYVLVEICCTWKVFPLKHRLSIMLCVCGLFILQDHYNQHGLLLLEGQGKGIYRLGDSWYEFHSLLRLHEIWHRLLSCELYRTRL